MHKFHMETKVTSAYNLHEVILVVKGISTEHSPIEYWCQYPDGSRETFQENSLKLYVPAFNPQMGEVYVNEHTGLEVTVLNSFNDFQGDSYVSYEWREGREIICGFVTLERFEKFYPEIKETR